ncbi:MAG: DUF4404 family protein [Anaerolineales bacterium]|jgi:predicted component of type VI protein secretion system
MSDPELRALLEQLHGELEHTQSVDKKGQELLRVLRADIRELLERSEAGPVQVHPSKLQHLEDSIRHFEVTHPHLTGMLSSLFEALSNAGI